MTGYALDNSWDRARRRLSLLEQYLDPMTRRRLTQLGVQPGSRCLEVGAGGGSVATWLSEQVGPAGKVVATDINIDLIKTFTLGNLEAVQHDITRDEAPGGGFDFVHARWILHHLPDPEAAIRRMINALRPGGWLLVEEVDFFPVHTSASQVYIDFMVALTGNVVRASGRDCFWARALPRVVAETGLEQAGGEGDFSLLRGGSPVAEFFTLTAEQMRDRMLASGEMSAERSTKRLPFWRLRTSGRSAAAASPCGVSARQYKRWNASLRNRPGFSAIWKRLKLRQVIRDVVPFCLRSDKDVHHGTNCRCVDEAPQADMNIGPLANHRVQK